MRQSAQLGITSIDCVRCVTTTTPPHPRSQRGDPPNFQAIPSIVWGWTGSSTFATVLAKRRHESNLGCDPSSKLRPSASLWRKLPPLPKPTSGNGVLMFCLLNLWDAGETRVQSLTLTSGIRERERFAAKLLFEGLDSWFQQRKMCGCEH